MTSMNLGRRNSLEIIASILNACRRGSKRTRVMGICNMSSKQFESYMRLLLEANLLSIEDDSRSPMLRVSTKGKNFLQAYNNMKTIMESQVTKTQ